MTFGIDLQLLCWFWCMRSQIMIKSALAWRYKLWPILENCWSKPGKTMESFSQVEFAFAGLVLRLGNIFLMGVTRSRSLCDYWRGFCWLCIPTSFQAVIPCPCHLLPGFTDSVQAMAGRQGPLASNIRLKSDSDQSSCLPQRQQQILLTCGSPSGDKWSPFGTRPGCPWMALEVRVLRGK